MFTKGILLININKAGGAGKVQDEGRGICHWSLGIGRESLRHSAADKRLRQITAF
jgi:hypothetical protein